VSAGYEIGAQSWVRSQGSACEEHILFNKECSFANFCKMSCKRATKRVLENKNILHPHCCVKQTIHRIVEKFHLRGSVLDKHKNEHVNHNLTKNWIILALEQKAATISLFTFLPF
jgi:hypothetical protein